MRSRICVRDRIFSVRCFGRGAGWRLRSTNSFRSGASSTCTRLLLRAATAKEPGELFRVTTLDLANPPKREDGLVDDAKDFFARRTYLTVSGQLEAEAFACALGKVCRVCRSAREGRDRRRPCIRVMTAETTPTTDLSSSAPGAAPGTPRASSSSATGARRGAWPGASPGDARTAEEVAQESLIAALGALDRFDPGRGTFRAWLHRITVNRALNAVRRERRHAVSTRSRTCRPSPPTTWTPASSRPSAG